MFKAGHIFTIRTKDAESVRTILAGGLGIEIANLNVLKENIKVGDFLFVVLAGGKTATPWARGLVAIAHVVQAPYDEGYDPANDKNFKIKVDVDVLFPPPISRQDLITYPNTFGVIGIGPIVKWEPNQAITSVDEDGAIAVLQAICEMRPDKAVAIRTILAADASKLDVPVVRFVYSTVDGERPHDLQAEFITWLQTNDTPRKVPKIANEYAKLYLWSINKDPIPGHANPAKSIWNDLYKFLYKKKAKRDVFHVKGFDDFREIYGDLDRAFSDEKHAGPFATSDFDQVYAWAHSEGNKGHVQAAYRAYVRFLKWRDGQKCPRVDYQEGDLFAIVLKLFKERRTTWTSSFIGEGAVYASVNTEVRNYFGDAANWNVETLAGAEAFKEFCIKHTWMLKNGNGAWASLSTYTDEQRKALLAWVDSRIVKQEKPLSEVVVDDNGFKGLTNKAVTELLMKFHPGQYCLCNGPTLEALKTLKLIDGGVSEKFAYNDYMQVMGACANVLARLKSANIHATADGTDNPDYIVVNEFLYFVSENFKEIKDEVIKMAAKPAERNPYDKTKGKKKSFNADFKEDQLMLRILASLRTKPFVILAGHSGTGKSRMVKKLAYMTCRDNKLHEGSDPGNYCIIEVKPNWHDSTELLGYFSSFGHDHYVTKQLVEFIMKAYAYPDVPFFVCLDEMNLAPVEQYFAEFLSALEDIHVDEGKMNEFFGLNAANKPEGSAAQEVVKYTSAPLIKPIDYKDDIAMLEPKTTQAMDWLKTHGLTIPKNLFVVGTVNMDESTNQFSRKVLDRAFTIEMTDARFEDFGDEDKDPMPTFAKEDEIDHALIDNLLTGKKQAGKLSTCGADTAQPKGQLENMNDLKGVLAGTPFVVAYRFANEYALYEDALNVLDVLADGASETDKAAKKAANAKRAFDDAVLMKLLPRIAGERAVVAEIFEGRKATDKRGEKDGLLKFLEYDKEQKKGTASGEKMTEILNRGNIPYLTFWP